MTNFAISARDVRDAADLLRGVAVRTPLLENAALNARMGRRVLIKFEGAQHGGAFKFRGAYNRLARIAPERRAAGVVAWSSGNHALGVANAARMLDMPATIVMPADAPEIKVAGTRALGAEILFYDRFTESREAIATALATERGATLVPSFDDPLVMAGQGTVGLEIMEQAAEAGAALFAILVCCGGGGLIAGVATAVCEAMPDVAIYAVEPAGFDDTARSLASGRREAVTPDARSICDALLAPMPGELTFPINHALLTGGLAVTDAQVRAAMRYAFETLKLVVEPGGAVALAALLQDLAPRSDAPIAIVLSGANVDAAPYAAILQGTD
ncbi:threonine dehydratase [Sphingobium fontiphilum]|uniref:Threonine dehydratase n=1 Tax=Sphingobium fontiphilum TaxID=944425 RepID=A0A7W6DI07_9SPHN|nr:threonine/serine dehydratase [Sphingobium fontiphilum]MBB3981686.1 threonine dehydratase [Sphingobium fontiphilum]